MTGRRLTVALLAYVGVLVLVITLVPFKFARPEHYRVMMYGGMVDVVANVVLFFPLGFLYRIARRNAAAGSALAVLALGLIVSAGIESAQLLEHDRYSSPIDVLTNGLGAWLGAVAHDYLARRARLDARMVGRLSLELPLMGLVYLLVPLLWLHALAAPAGVARSWGLVALGLFGANLLGAMQRHHFGPAGALSRRGMALAAGAWFVAGCVPVMARAPRDVLVAAAVVTLATYLAGRTVRDPGGANRRFEVPTLRGAAPLYGAFLLLMAIAPLGAGTAEWTLHAAFGSIPGGWTPVAILRVLEWIASFTLLGYMIAEFRSRLESSFATSFAMITAWAAVAAVVVQGARGFEPGAGASVAQGVLLVAACVYGGWLYHLQRAHVQRLTAAKTPAPDAAGAHSIGVSSRRSGAIAPRVSGSRR